MLTISVSMPAPTPTDNLVWFTENRSDATNSYFYSYISEDDGGTWTENLFDTALLSNPGGNYYDMTYGNGIFIVLSRRSNAPLYGIFFSTDGGSNFDLSGTFTEDALLWYSSCFNGSVFCAVSTGVTTKVITSPDGDVWTTQNFDTAFPRSGVAYNGTDLCAVGIDAGVAKASLSSDDGVNWTDYTIAMAGFSPGRVKWNGALFCCIASSTNTNKAYTSPDGQTWTQRDLGATKRWESLWWDGAQYIAVATLDGWTTTSADGITWSAASTAFLGSTAHPIGVSNGSISCTLDGADATFNTMALSVDGVTWTPDVIGMNFDGSKAQVGTTKLFFGTY